jgi:integrase
VGERRDYKTGSVYQRRDGRWVGAISSGWTERGTRRRYTVTAKTKAEAKRRLNKKRLELDAGRAAEVSERTTVKAWADEWLPIVERTLRPNSMTATRSAVTKWIVPTVGHRRLSDLSPADIRAVAKAQRAAGKSSSTQRRTHSVLMTMLNAANAEGHAVPARVLAVKAPEKAVSDRNAIPVPDALKMVAAAVEQGPRQAARLLANILLGARQGEALGLTLGVLDFDRKVVTVSWQLQPLPYNVPRDRKSGFRVPDGYESRQVRGRWHLVRPKSASGWRIHPMLPWMEAALRAWIEVMPEAPHGMLFHHPVGDPPKIDDAEWYALQDAAGVRHPTGRRYTIHEGRHTAASLMLEAGVPMTVIVALLGHSSYASTQAYLHVRTDALADALAKTGAILGLGDPHPNLGVLADGSDDRL